MLSNSELSTLFSQLSLLVHAGISTLEGISIIREDVSDPQAKKLLSAIYDGLEMQQEFSEVLKETGAFPKYAVDMVRIGSYSGTLDEVLSALSVYYEREEQISAGIRDAVTYPAVMLVMLFIVIGVLIAKVLPVFNDVYRQLGTELTGPAKTLMNFSSVIQKILPEVVLVLILAALLLIYLLKKKSSVFSHVILSRKLSEAIAVGRFASGLALTLHSGLDTDKSLKMTAELTDHAAIQAKIKKCQEMQAAGMGFAESITACHIFTGTQSRMITIGLRSGALDQIMEDIARQCNDETDARIRHLLSILEPTLVAILAIIVGVILLSVMLPLMGIMANMGA